MKEIDDTEPAKSESEQHEQEIQELRARLWQTIAKLEALELRIANLESQKPPQATNPDPEWYS
tara:strand:- start:185 stop:373 length:189 start_codon:yes stop_codon:yes gene_type:complete